MRLLLTQPVLYWTIVKSGGCQFNPPGLGGLSVVLYLGLLNFIWQPQQFPLNRGSRKKLFFFSGPTTKALTFPLELSGHPFLGLFFKLHKKFFFLSGQAFTPPPHT